MAEEGRWNGANGSERLVGRMDEEEDQRFF